MESQSDSTNQPWNDRLYLPAYRYSEAARLAETTPQSVARWFRGYQVPGHRMKPVFPSDHPHLLSYVQLVEVAFVAAFRRIGVKLDDLRRAHAYLRADFGTEYPFAQLKLKTDGTNILADVLPEAQHCLVVANRGGQLVWTEVIRERFEQFDYEEGLALRWHPRGRNSAILIDPPIAFGAPIIAGTGVPTRVVKERYVAGEDIQEIEEDFGVSRHQVEEALDFEGSRLPAA